MVTLLLLACTPDPAATDPLAGLKLQSEDPSDGPIVGLDTAWMDRFNAGDATFEAVFRETQGLGPLYIRASCASCHADDARGPGVVRKMVVPDDPELDAELLPFGHTERPYVAADASTPLLPPEDERVWVSVRSPPAVFGRGYLEAVADDTLLDLADAQADAGVVSGRVNLVPCDVAANPDSDFAPCTPGTTVVGRFGLKARIPTLDAFSADAYQGDMGITSPLRPDEPANPDGLSDDAYPGIDVDLETLNLTADYMRLLAIPRRDPPPEGAAQQFVAVGCADCHVASLPTRSDWPVPQIAGMDAEVYTDLLLHDMGSDRSDGLTDHDAAPSEWRTAPLMGLRFLTSYLHDGAAQTVEEAILGHDRPGSEASPSVQQYLALDAETRAELLTFVESL